MVASLLLHLLLVLETAHAFLPLGRSVRQPAWAKRVVTRQSYVGMQQSDDASEADSDVVDQSPSITSAFAVLMQEEASKEAAEAAQQAVDDAQRKKANDIELRAKGVSRSRLAWGYTTDGPEPEPLFELSGLLAGVLIFVGPLLFLSFAGQDQCAIRPTQEVCLAKRSASQLSQSGQQIQEARQQAALNNAMRRQCLRNAMSEEDEGKCPAPLEVVVPGRNGIF